MTEDQIERAVQHRTDAIDASFMRGDIDQAQYDAAMKALSQWADRKYESARYDAKYSRL